MNREQIFANKMEELCTLAKRQGNVLSREQIIEILGEAGIGEESLTPVFEYLKSKKIGVDEKVSLDDYLTAEDLDYLQMYMDELKELPVYSDGEKEAYYLSAMAGEGEAQSKVIEIMLESVVDMAKLYSGQNVTIEDLVGEGNLALSVGVTMLGALETPTEVPGALAQMVMNAMEELIGIESDSKKTDSTVEKRVNKVADAARELAEDYGRKVTIDELVAEGNVSRKAIEEAIKLTGMKIEDIDYNGQ